MKRYLYLLLLFPIIIIGQTSNYIKSTTYKQASLSTIANPTTSQTSKEITYFDGLGRPIQKIANAQSPLGKDIITPIQYDDFGRQIKEYLPYTSSQSNMALNNNSSIITALTNQYQTFYSDGSPYSGKEMEVSPTNRIVKQSAPGTDWTLGSGHEIKMDYKTNIANEVKRYKVGLSFANNTYTPALIWETTFYTPNELYKMITKDENWTSGFNHTTEEFKDKQDRVILKRTYDNNIPHDTYYIYDDYGNLTYVVPPKASDLGFSASSANQNINSTAVVVSGATLQLTASNSIVLQPGFHAQSGSIFSAKITGGDNKIILDNLCYQYKYDHKNRLVEKKLPGKEWEYIVYDKLDRPILTQDANLKAQNKWLFTKYDAFNRPVYTGEYTKLNQNSRIELQAIADGASVLSENKQGINTINNSTVYYSNNIFPNTDINLFTISYYDDYNFDINGGIPENVGTVTPSTASMSLATGTKVRILGTNFWTTNVVYYDQKGRVIYNYSKNDFLGLIQKVKTELDFEGKAIKITTKHTKGATVDIIDTFTYDNQNRLLTQTQKINSQVEEVIVSNKYDELGQLIQKGVGGKSSALNRLQTVDYTYNIRGWLKGINDTGTSNSNITMGTGDLFGFKINYNNPAAGTALFNGNISQTFWKTTNPLNTSLRNYNYSYDALNRLTSAVDNLARYNESLSYDKNGNIMTLIRTGNTDANAANFGTMDNLTYTYSGNRLNAVEDSSGSNEGFKDGSHTAQEYTYDDNGNMKTDNNKGITAITYNHLNLPTDITLTGGTIHYDYDAIGVKQRKIVGTITTDYAVGFQYEKVGSGTQQLKFFPIPEGYAENNNGTFNYIYQYKDHLGNIRLSYKDVGTSTPSLQIVEENNYYPFGMKQKVAGEVINQTGYRYKYNAKELQDELGLNFYDYGARNYDPVLGRFFSVDTMAESFMNLSTYQYAGNTPTFFIDVNGEYIYINDPESNEKYRYQNGKTQHQVNGKWQNIEPNAVLSDFVLNSVSQINFLENSGKTGAGLVSKFSVEGLDVTFKYRALKDGGNEAVFAGSKGQTENTIFFDNKNSQNVFTTSGYLPTEGFIAIGHEMAHLTGLRYEDSWLNNYSKNNPDGAPSRSEIRATHYENLIRAESGKPLRTHYSALFEITTGKTTPNTKTTLIDKAGNSVYYNTSTRMYPGTLPTLINDGINANNGRILTSRYNYYNDKK